MVTFVVEALVYVTLASNETITLTISPLEAVDFKAKVFPQELIGGSCSVNCWQPEELVGTLAQRLPLNKPTAFEELI